jgi:hypothetical protein
LGRGRPNLKDYGECLDNMRRLLIEYQKCPNLQTKYEIETELIRLRSIREELENRFRFVYKYKEKVLENILRGDMTQKENR